MGFMYGKRYEHAIGEYVKASRVHNSEAWEVDRQRLCACAEEWLHQVWENKKSSECGIAMYKFQDMEG